MLIFILSVSPVVIKAQNTMFQKKLQLKNTSDTSISLLLLVEI